MRTDEERVRVAIGGLGFQALLALNCQCYFRVGVAFGLF